MITKEYAMAYTEVIEILKYVPDEEVQKIPKQKLDFYRKNMDKQYNYKVDTAKDFEEQKLSDVAKAIFANIFRDYWATDNQREKIKSKEKYDMEQIEKSKYEKYNPDNIFRKKKENISEIQNNMEHTDIVVAKKEKWYLKILNILKNFFKKNG